MMNYWSNLGVCGDLGSNAGIHTLFFLVGVSREAMLSNLSTVRKGLSRNTFDINIVRIYIRA